MSSGHHLGQSSAESWASVQVFQELSSKFISISWVCFRTVIMKMTFAPCSLRNFLSRTTGMTTLRHSLHLQLQINPQKSSWGQQEVRLLQTWAGQTPPGLSWESPLHVPLPHLHNMSVLQGTMVWGSLGRCYQAWTIYRNFSCPEAAHQDSRIWLIHGISIWCWHHGQQHNTNPIFLEILIHSDTTGW